MMVELLAQSEAIPAAYPAIPSGLSSGASDLDPAAIWGRIEAYTAHRFTPRAVAWTIQGDAGAEWTPPLMPLGSHSEERWWDAQWTAVDLLPGIHPIDTGPALRLGPVKGDLGKAFAVGVKERVARFRANVLRSKRSVLDCEVDVVVDELAPLP